jgi:hypothetical protein
VCSHPRLLVQNDARCLFSYPDCVSDTDCRGYHQKCVDNDCKYNWDPPKPCKSSLLKTINVDDYHDINIAYRSDADCPNEEFCDREDGDRDGYEMITPITNRRRLVSVTLTKLSVTERL